MLKEAAAQLLITGKVEFTPEMEKIADAVVAVFMDSDGDEEMLRKLVLTAIAADRAIKLRGKGSRAVLIEKLAKLTPEERRKHDRSIKTAAEARRRNRDPEAYYERQKRKIERLKARNPEKLLERYRKEKARKAARIANDPKAAEREREKRQRQTRRSWARRNPEKMRDLVDSIVPKTHPQPMRLELMSMLTERFMTGVVARESLKSELKSVMTAYWKIAPSKFGPRSLDAIVPGTDNLRLIDTLADNRRLT